MKTLYALILFSLTIVSCNNSSQEKVSTSSKHSESQTALDPNLEIAQNIANACGVQNWDKVTEIAFTFNMDRAGKHFERSWIWKPKSGDVRMLSEQDTIDYNRSSMDSVSKKSDAAFINDKYWLLAPFQLVWDKGMDYTNTPNAQAPISKDTLSKLTIVYPNEGGYTPGDAYDFFYDKQYRIKEWNYRRQNTEQPSLSTTWEDYTDFDGIIISLMRRDTLNNAKWFFTNISIKQDN